MGNDEFSEISLALIVGLLALFPIMLLFWWAYGSDEEDNDTFKA